MKPRWFLAGITLVLLFAQPFAVSLRAQPAAIEDIGTLGLDAYARAVNAAGEAAGISLVTPTDSRGFVTSGGGLTPIPTFGGTESAAYGLGDSGLAVGFARRPDAEPRAFRFDPATSDLLDLGTLGGEYAVAYGINASGTIAGYAATADGLEEAFAWTPGGGMQSLGTLGGVVSYAYGINDAGEIVGESHTADDAVRAFLYSGGMLHDLGTLGGLDSAALAVNASGAVTGWSQIAGFGTRAFRRAPGGPMQALPTLGGSFASGEAIAPDGTIVGYSSLADGTTRACLWTPAGDAVDLNTLIDPSTGWTLIAANGINGSGQVVGYGTVGTSARAFRLTLPTPPAAGAAPTIHSVTATPSSLWPANNKLVNVHVTVVATDESGGTPPCQITGITSNEPAEGDIVVAGPWDLQLRATRLGTGSGRTYRIDVACGSSPDAMAAASVDVVVPKSQAGGARR